LPKGGLLDRKYEGWSAEEIYDDVLDQVIKNGKGKGKGEGDGSGGTIIVPKGSWGDSDMRDDLGKKGQGDGEGEGDGPPVPGQGRSESENRAHDTYWKVAIVEAAQIHEKQNGRGTLPAGLQKLIDEITDPKISWVDVLSRWVGENGRRADFTYRRPARRSDAIGEILPAMQKHGVDDLVVLWDTSGSMGGRETEILSEVIGICEDLSMALRVICCDAAVHSDQSDVEHPDDVNVKGGGGSDFTPAFDLLHEEGYDGVVVAFTDGYIGVPSVKPPHLRDVLWVLWQARDVDPTGGKWGETLIVDKDGNQVN
jgi:predicted metal-dependent peptidase